MESKQVRRVISYNPNFVKFISDEKTIKLIRDKNHYPILKILKKNPMTVRELEEAYKEVTNIKKSNKTIYRYLKALEEVGLVQPAGQLVVTGKTATETIFARTAMAFYLKDNDSEEFWDSEKGNRIIQVTGKILSPLFDNKPPKIEELTKLIKEYRLNGVEVLERLTNNVEDEITSSISECDFDEINQILKMTVLLASIKLNPKIAINLDNCF